MNDRLEKLKFISRPVKPLTGDVMIPVERYFNMCNYENSYMKKKVCIEPAGENAHRVEHSLVNFISDSLRNPSHLVFLGIYCTSFL